MDTLLLTPSYIQPPFRTPRNHCGRRMQQGDLVGRAKGAGVLFEGGRDTMPALYDQECLCYAWDTCVCV